MILINMNNWTESKIGDIADIIMGQSPSGETCHYNKVGYPLLNGPTEFTIKYPVPVQYTNAAKRLCQVNDILFCVRGSTTGRMNWADQIYAIGRGLASIRHKKGKEYQVFLKGLIDYHLDEILSKSTGSVFPNITSNDLKELKTLLPPLSEQKAIASILSSIDDKIDLLHRQNKTLEALAETIFRQWFVEETDETWKKQSLFDAIELIGGGTPKTEITEYWNGNIKWLSGGDITANHKNFVMDTEKSITELGLQNSSAKLLPKYSTVISARGTVGKYCLLSESMAFSQSNYGIKPKYNGCFFFTYLLISYSVDELLAAAYGSVFDTITTTTFKEQKISLPGNSMIMQFEEIITPYFKKMEHNQIQIRTLTQLRNTLLPKMMSGEVKVNL